jgi:DNA-directed RNA polymerase subunit K/omega
VIAVAKRARQIIARRENGLVLAHKPVTIALEEIEQGRVRLVSKPEADGEAERPVESRGIPEVETEVQTGEAGVPQEAAPAPEPEKPKS